MPARFGVVLVVVVLGASACSVETTTHPGEFAGMSSDEVGCTVVYGEEDPIVVGPLGPGEFEIVEPNDSASFRVARTASDVIIVAAHPNGASTISYPLDDLPDDGVVARGPFRDSDDPGYKVTCWRGEA